MIKYDVKRLGLPTVWCVNQIKLSSQNSSRQWNLCICQNLDIFVMASLNLWTDISRSQAQSCMDLFSHNLSSQTYSVNHIIIIQSWTQSVTGSATRTLLENTGSVSQRLIQSALVRDTTSCVKYPSIMSLFLTRLSYYTFEDHVYHVIGTKFTVQIRKLDYIIPGTKKNPVIGIQGNASF